MKPNTQVQLAINFWNYFSQTPPQELLNFWQPNQNHKQEVSDTKILNSLKQDIYKYVPILKHFPGIKAVAICNSVALKTVHPKSDIDLFIVCHKKLLFTARILTSLYFHLIRKRRHHDFRQARFCLSFYISDDHINLTSVALKNDVYLYYWLLTLQWVITPESRSSWINHFISQNNDWLKPLIGLDDAKNISNKLQRFKHFSRNSKLHHLKKIMILAWQPLEAILRHYQLNRAQKKCAKHNHPYGVVISTQILKFHVVDKRKEIKEYLDGLV